MRTGCIYTLRDNKGKAFYVGSTIHPDMRSKYHRRNYVKHTFNIEAEDISEEDLWDHELKFIHLFRSMGALLKNKRYGRGVYPEREAVNVLENCKIEYVQNRNTRKKKSDQSINFEYLN